MRRLILIFLFVGGSLWAKIPIKTPNDVYAYATLLKDEVAYLREKSGVKEPFPDVGLQQNKRPRHVIQKALEILGKINRYRINHNFGPITIPPYPPREVTPQDVYDLVKRLDGEVRVFIDDKGFLEKLKRKKFDGKSPSDVYRLLWSISLGFDALLGVQGYTPTDVFALSQKVVNISRFLRNSQNDYSDAPKPERIEGQHPNHALYAAIDFLQKVSSGQKKLWIDPADVPEAPRRVITPTEVYDMLQYNIAELQRIKYRLGVERYFKIVMPESDKTPSDVVQNIEYAKRLLPDFSLEEPLVQYPPSSLKKSPNHVYGVTVDVLKKLEMLRTLRGIHQLPKDPPKIYGLKPMHSYQKGIETIEKATRLKIQMGFFPSQIPTAPFRAITPSEVYELILRLDGIVTILLRASGETGVEEYIYQHSHTVYTDKTPSDVYYNLWKISKMLDLLSGSEYTPNETYALAMKIDEKSKMLLKYFNLNCPPNTVEKKFRGKRPKDVYHLTRILNAAIAKIQKRANMSVTAIKLPDEDVITPNTVYNALRIINASVNEILIHLNIDAEDIEQKRFQAKGKTPSDVYQVVQKTIDQIELMFLEECYEK